MSRLQQVVLLSVLASLLPVVQCASRGPLTVESVAVRAIETLNVIGGIQSAVITAEADGLLDEAQAVRAMRVIRRALVLAEGVPAALRAADRLTDDLAQDNALAEVQAVLLTLSQTLGELRGVVPDAVADTSATVLHVHRLLVAVTDLRGAL